MLSTNMLSFFRSIKNRIIFVLRKAGTPCQCNAFTRLAIAMLSLPSVFADNGLKTFLQVSLQRKELFRATIENDDMSRFRRFGVFSFFWTVPLRLASRLREYGGIFPILWSKKNSIKHTVSCTLRCIQMLFSSPKSILKCISYFRIYGFDAALQRFRCFYSESVPDEKIFDLHSTKKVYILTTQHCLFVAELIQYTLAKTNIFAEIIFKCPEDGFGLHPYFVICPQMFSKLPVNYIAFQMEQSINSRWFTPKYFAILKNAYAIFDYSIANIDYLHKQSLPFKNIFYMPLSSLPVPEMIFAQKKNTILFYGDTNCDRRKKMLEYIQKKHSVCVINNSFGESMQEALQKASIVINIHYYEGALLETTRIHECISRGCLVLSEMSSDMDQHDDLKEIVDFVPIGDSESMTARLDYWLDNATRLKEKIATNQKKIAEQPHLFTYYFLRFLLASGNIDFQTFYTLGNKDIHFDKNAVCLSLPESTERHTEFEKSNSYGFCYFPGLRHATSWIGCGYSYKCILRKACDLGMEQITVCEDDVEFYPGWEEKFSVVQEYLQQYKNWSLFSGLIADVHPETKILHVETYKGLKFITIDKTVSNVFNIYSRDFYSAIQQWNENNKDLSVNTIDRFIESMPDLRVILVFPFFVGHKEEMYSTIWSGNKNTVYTEWFARSNKLLQEKIEAWEQA